MIDLAKIRSTIERHRLKLDRFWATVELLRSLGVEVPPEIEDTRPIYYSSETGMHVLVNDGWIPLKNI